MVEQRRRFTVVRAAGWGQEPSRSGAWLRSCRNGWRVLFTRTTDLDALACSSSAGIADE